MTRPLLALAAALLGSSALAKPATPALPRGVMGDVQVKADHVSYEVSTGRVLLEGNAVVRRGAIVVRARSAVYDPATGEVRASGHVLLTDATRVISADAVRALVGGEFEAEGVLAFVKDRPVDLSGVATVEEAARTGRNRVQFSTPRLRGTADHLQLADVRLTLCDCPRGGPPSWEITARSADVIPGVRATLWWPVLRIAGPWEGTAPILIVPWMYVPLGERQSGFLIPVVSSTGSSGFSVSEPYFLTLGRSADATIAPEYAWGRKRSDVAAGKPSVRGPGVWLELRWAPAEGALGRAQLAWLDDLDAEPGGEHGQRGALTLTHGQILGDATSLRVGLHLAGDSVWVRDMNPDVLGKALPYWRSDLLVSHRGDAIVTEGVASYDQPLDPVTVGTGEPWGTLGASRGVSSRFGAAAATLVPVAAGPLLLSGRVGAARFGPVHGLGAEGLDVVGRPAVTRADARAEVALPLLLGGVVTFAPFFRAAALAYDPAPEPAGSTGIAWGVAGAALETEVSRRFATVRHTITPRLEWRAGTQAVGDVLQAPAYDLFDRSSAGGLSASPGVFQQLRASVETRLETAKATVLRANLGQDADLHAGRLAETFAALGFTAGPVVADTGVRFFPVDRGIPVPPARIPSPLDKFTELRASLGVHDSRGDSVSAGFLSIGPGGPGSLMAGLDPLFDVRPATTDAAGNATLGVRAVLGNARLGYDALLPGRPAFVPGCDATGGTTSERRVNALQVQQHTGSITWESSCHCFRLLLLARITDCGGFSYSASIDFGRPGTGGAAH